jgi:hypothetical protein
MIDAREVDRVKLLGRVRAVQTPVQTSNVGKLALAGTF